MSIQLIMVEFVQLKLRKVPNIGLINTLSTYAKIDQFGFLQSPYHRVSKGVVDKNPKNVSIFKCI